MHKVFVFGSLNMDLVINSPREVKQGETIHGSGFMSNGGGKGANQATACGKLGANIIMGGAVGKDEFGKTLLNNLKNVNVNVDTIREIDGVSTGVAVILIVNKDNRIVLDGGANLVANNNDVDRLLEEASEKDIFLTQLENKLEVVGYALEKAKEKGMTTILNPAPINPEVVNYISYVDYFIPNETELALVSGTESIEDGVKVLVNKGVKSIIVTLGSKGYCYYENGKINYGQGMKMNVVDTTAAGDTFCGGFATYMSQGKSLAESLEFANKAAALTVTKKGAQQAIPTLQEFKEYYK